MWTKWHTCLAKTCPKCAYLQKIIQPPDVSPCSPGEQGRQFWNSSQNAYLWVVTLLFNIFFQELALHHLKRCSASEVGFCRFPWVEGHRINIPQSFVNLKFLSAHGYTWQQCWKISNKKVTKEVRSGGALWRRWPLMRRFKNKGHKSFGNPGHLSEYERGDMVKALSWLGASEMDWSS